MRIIRYITFSIVWAMTYVLFLFIPVWYRELIDEEGNIRPSKLCNTTLKPWTISLKDRWSIFIPLKGTINALLYFLSYIRRVSINSATRAKLLIDQLKAFWTNLIGQDGVKAKLKAFQVALKGKLVNITKRYKFLHFICWFLAGAKKGDDKDFIYCNPLHNTRLSRWFRKTFEDILSPSYFILFRRRPRINICKGRVPTRK